MVLKSTSFPHELVWGGITCGEPFPWTHKVRREEGRYMTVLFIFSNVFYFPLILHLMFTGLFVFLFPSFLVVSTFVLWCNRLSLSPWAKRNVCVPPWGSHSMCLTVKTVYQSLHLLASDLSLTGKQNRLGSGNEVYEIMKRESLTRNCNHRLVPHHGWKRN